MFLQQNQVIHCKILGLLYTFKQPCHATVPLCNVYVYVHIKSLRLRYR